LLTFWPPGPDECVNDTVISPSGITIAALDMERHRGA
jgi:hypothetical protein